MQFGQEAQLNLCVENRCHCGLVHSECWGGFVGSGLSMDDTPGRTGPGQPEKRTTPMRTMILPVAALLLTGAASLSHPAAAPVPPPSQTLLL